MDDIARNTEALILFHMAIANTILGLDLLVPEHRTPASFLIALDSQLSDIPNMPYIPGFPDMDGPEMYERVKVFRGNLDVALNQARQANKRFEDLDS